MRHSVANAAYGLVVNARNSLHRALAPPDEWDDVALVAAAIAGDRRALRALYDRHRPAVARVARGFATLDRDEADDIVQDTFIRAFENLPKLANPARFASWILAIARNRALSRLGRRRSAARLSDELQQEVAALALDVVEMPEVGDDEELRLIREILAGMPDGPERETVQLFYVEGELSAREIAERLGVGKSTITMRLERFRAKVKCRLLAAVAGRQGERS